MLFCAAKETAHRHDQPSRSRSRRLVYSFIVLFLALLVIELGLQFFFFMRGKIHPFYQQALHISPYANLDWPQEYFTEERRTKNQFVPYRMWCRQEFQGRHLNISSEGLRRTWNPPVPSNQALKKIFCFGGSTTWGVGARDDFTIPSLLSKKLNQGAPHYLVTNYGEKGYCLTQEIVYLTLLLKQGRVPDYVIFYDGINEVMVGYKNKKAGSIFGVDYMRRRLYHQDTVAEHLTQIWRRSGLYRGTKELKDLVKAPFKTDQPLTPEDNQTLERLADDIVADYLRNMELVHHLARAYGFQYLFIWQPALCTNQALTAEEKQLAAWSNKRMVRLYELVYARMARVQRPRFYNIATMFDRKKNTLYFSWAHITEEGNSQVAARLARIFQQEFPSDFATPPGGRPNPG
ncbi:MAG: SGNH/GDSL hydrolase family protein [Thermodesulfobacteriota bacterium]